MKSPLLLTVKQEILFKVRASVWNESSKYVVQSIKDDLDSYIFDCVIIYLRQIMLTSLHFYPDSAKSWRNPLQWVPELWLLQQDLLLPRDHGAECGVRGVDSRDLHQESRGQAQTGGCDEEHWWIQWNMKTWVSLLWLSPWIVTFYVKLSDNK